MTDPLGLLTTKEEDPLGLLVQPIAGTAGATKIRREPHPIEKGILGASELAGLTVGAKYGATGGTALLGPGPGTVAGGMVGAGLGYAFARQANQFALEARGYREPEPPETRFLRAAYDIPLGGVMEGGGQAVAGVVGKVAAPFSKYLSTPEGAEVVSIFKQYGIKPTAGQVKPGSKTFGILESVLGYRPFSGDVMVSNSMKQVDMLNNVREQLIAKGAPSDTVEVIGGKIQKELATIFQRHGVGKSTNLQGMVDTAMNQFGAKITKHQAGSVWSNTMEEGERKVYGGVRKLYDDLAKKIPKNRSGAEFAVATPETEVTAQEILDFQAKVKMPSGAVKRTAEKFIPKEGGEILDIGGEGFKKLNPQVQTIIENRKQGVASTWSSLDNDQSMVLEQINRIRAANFGKETRSTHYLGKLHQSILKDMESYARQQGPEVYKLYQQARAASKFYHDVFDRDILKIMKKNPEDVVDAVLRRGKDSVTYLRQVKLATGEAGIEPLKAVSTTRLFENSRKTGVFGDVIDPKVLNKNWSSIPQDTRDMLFSEAEQSLISNVIQKGEKIAYQMEGTKTSQFINRIVNAQPQSVVDFLLQSKAESHAHIARKVLSKERLDEVTSELMGRVLRLSGEKKLLVTSANKEFQKYDRVLQELLKNQSGGLSPRYYGLKKFLSIGDNMKRAEQLFVNASQTGQVLLGSQIASSTLRAGIGAVVGGASSQDRTGGALTGAIAGLTLPYMIAKIYTSDAASRYFTRAIGLNPGSKEAIRLFTISMMALGRPEQEQTEKVTR